MDEGTDWTRLVVDVVDRAIALQLGVSRDAVRQLQRAARAKLGLADRVALRHWLLIGLVLIPCERTSVLDS